MTPRAKRLVGWGLAAAVLGSVLGLAIAAYVAPWDAAEESISIGGEFTLVDQDGRTVTKPDFDAKALALFAGFTYCPDVCPATLLRLASFLDQLGADAGKIQVVLFSVDPERDTPAVLKSYIASFDKRFSAVTGTPEQVKAFAKAYRIFYAKVPREGGDYTMNHSAGVFLFEKGGTFQGTLDLHEADDVAVAKLKMLVE